MLKEVICSKEIKNAKVIYPKEDIRILQEQILGIGNIAVNTMAVV